MLRYRIRPSAWKGNSANFAVTAFSEVLLTIILGSSYTRCCIAGVAWDPQSLSKTLGAKGRSPAEPRPSLLAFHWGGGSKGGKGCSGGGGTSRRKLRRKDRKSRGLCRGKKRPLS